LVSLSLGIKTGEIVEGVPIYRQFMGVFYTGGGQVVGAGQ
jgi:hypothetical protein